MTEFANIEEAILALEDPLYYLGSRMSQDQLEDILQAALSDVYEEEPSE